MSNFEQEKIFKKQEKEIIDKKVPFDQEHFYYFRVKEIRERESHDSLNLDWPAEIYLKDNQSNTLIDFKKDILPEGWRIESPIYPGFYCDEKDKKVMVPQTFSRAQEILSFLHEAGHAHTVSLFTDQEKIFWNKVNSIWIEMNEIRKILRAVQEKDYSTYLKEQYQGLKDQWQKENLDEGIKVIAKRERSAWEWAFKKVRAIKKTKKIDLLKPFKIWGPELAEDWRRKNWQEVRKYVQNRSLNVYEMQAFDQTEGRLAGYFSKENYPKPFKK